MTGPQPPMADDIVERLREPGDLHGGWLDTMLEAAAELERLRGELARSRAHRALEVADALAVLSALVLLAALVDWQARLAREACFRWRATPAGRRALSEGE